MAQRNADRPVIDGPGQRIFVRIQLVNMPIQQAEVPIQQAEVPIQQADAPIQQAEVPIQQAEAPIQEAEDPIQQMPLQEELAPIQEDNMPIQQVPIQEDTSPIQQVPHQEELAPIEEEIASTQQVPIEEDIAPIQQVPIEEDIVPVEEDFGPIEEDIVPVEENLNEIRFVQLPFYDIEKEILKPMILHVNEGQNELDKKYYMDFELPADLIGTLSFLDDALPRYEIQLRLALYNIEKEQPDDFPNEVKITLNEFEVELPPEIRTPTIPGQPNQIKRESRPANLTPYLNRTPGVSQKLKIEWRQDPRLFVIGIWLVQQISWEMLRDRFMADKDAQCTFTREVIQKRLAVNPDDEDDDVSMDSLKVSLICPYSRAKMVVPIRSLSCTHIQCFDLNNYLQMNKLKPNWKCPVCGNYCRYNSLKVDQYFLDVIQKVGKSVNEVELLPSGDWKTANGNDNMQVPRVDTSSADTTDGHLTTQHTCPDEVITLESSADEEDTQIDARNTRKRTHDQMTELDRNGQPITTLDEE